MSHPSLYENLDSIEMVDQRDSKDKAAPQEKAQSEVEPSRRRSLLLFISGFLSFCVFLSLILLLVGLLNVAGKCTKMMLLQEDLQAELTQLKNKECPRNWRRFRQACYYFSTQKGNWQFAKQQCSLEYSHLLVISNAAKRDFITKEANHTLYWIGLKDLGGGNWTWVDGTACRPSSTFWTVGEPNNWHGRIEDCVHIEKEGRWNDNQCSANLSWICEKKIKSA
ncbi:hepatic lectin-like [Mustelus asterias]